jgi:hypothetical protein
VTILVHVLSILGDMRGIKCTCKTATRAAFTGKMNSDQATCRLVSFFFFFNAKTTSFWVKIRDFAEVQCSPLAFNLVQLNP